MKIEHMAHASKQTMADLGFYWGGCSYDEDKERWIGIETIGDCTFVINVAYAIGDDSWFAEAYDLFDLPATVDGWLGESPQDALDGLIEQLKKDVARWEAKKNG